MKLEELCVYFLFTFTSVMICTGKLICKKQQRITYSINLAPVLAKDLAQNKSVVL
jgi:hypothetical protein